MLWLCALPILMSLLPGCGAPEPFAGGYVEGEYVLLAPIDTARIEEIAVRKGDRVEAGQMVARLETRDAEIAVAERRAALEQSQAELANLQKGKRPEEIAVIEADLAAAEARLRDAQRKFKRQVELRDRGFASQAEYDAASTALDLAEAEAAQLRANLEVARLPARQEEIVAAANRVEQARAALASAKWRLEQRIIHAPAKGQISDIILRPGEVAGPAAPLVSFLPEGAVKLKLYVPEDRLSSITRGTVLTVYCDGCEPQSATVDYVSPEPEFTPPVIYSIETRQKLVYLIEARPGKDAVMLKPGQIVDVALAGEAEEQPR